MIKKVIQHLSLFAIVVGVIGMFGFNSNFDAYASSQSDYEMTIKSTAEKCKQKHDSYRILGESEFRIQNIGMVSLNDCIKAYKGPNWNSNHHNIDGLIMELLELKSYSIITEKKDGVENMESKIEKLYTVGIGKEMHFVKFNVCAGSSMAQFPEVSITTDKENKTVKFQKLIMPETCRVHEYKVSAKYAESIVLSLLDLQLL